MRIAAIAAMLVGLAGCGVDGDPIQPSLNTSVSVGTNGVRTSTNLGLNSGPVHIGIRL